MDPDPWQAMRRRPPSHATDQQPLRGDGPAEAGLCGEVPC
jgi:hypothetical protein